MPELETTTPTGTIGAAPSTGAALTQREKRDAQKAQLRPLADGIPIGVAIAHEPPANGIDTEDDLSRANARWHEFIAGR